MVRGDRNKFLANPILEKLSKSGLCHLMVLRSSLPHGVYEGIRHPSAYITRD
jgi:hypothetical protein